MEDFLGESEKEFGSVEESEPDEEEEFLVVEKKDFGPIPKEESDLEEEEASKSGEYDEKSQYSEDLSSNGFIRFEPHPPSNKTDLIRDVKFNLGSEGFPSKDKKKRYSTVLTRLVHT